MASRCAAVATLVALSASPAFAQSCPAPLASAKRLALVTAETMGSTSARLQLFEREASGKPWRAIGPPEPAVIGRTGMAWSRFFRSLARPGEPLKVEHDKSAPAGIFPVGRSFGTVPSSRPGYIQVTDDTVCVDDPRSPAYNTITSRALAGRVSVENMSHALPMYRRGLVIDYPTDARAQAGSCIFLHVWRSPTTGTAGCVALPEARVVAMQDFSAEGAVIAILPRQALGRLGHCLPAVR